MQYVSSSISPTLSHGWTHQRAWSHRGRGDLAKESRHRNPETHKLVGRSNRPAHHCRHSRRDRPDRMTFWAIAAPAELTPNVPATTGRASDADEQHRCKIYLKNGLCEPCRADPPGHVHHASVCGLMRYRHPGYVERGVMKAQIEHHGAGREQGDGERRAGLRRRRSRRRDGGRAGPVPCQARSAVSSARPGGGVTGTPGPYRTMSWFCPGGSAPGGATRAVTSVGGWGSTSVGACGDGSGASADLTGLGAARLRYVRVASPSSAADGSKGSNPGDSRPIRPA